MAGQKTSIYLTEEVAQRVRASGLPLPELVRRGLDAGQPPELEVIIRRVVREELAEDRRGRGAGVEEQACKHPAASVEDSVCRNCGADVWLRP